MQAPPADSPLTAVAILEKDRGGDTALVWCYPAISSDLEPIILRRSQLREESPVQASFSKFRESWIYNFLAVPDVPAQDGKPKHPLSHVLAYAIVVVSKAFDPERFGSLARILSSAYAQQGSAVNVLQAYSRGECTVGTETYRDGAFEARNAYLATSIKDVTKLFGPEMVLLWSALLMKKRVVVYSEKLTVLLRVIRALPLLVSYRQNWSILRPLVTLQGDLEIADLKASGVYCAGFTDPAVRLREDLYDLFVDINARSVTVPEHAKSEFGMGSLHKEIATYLVEAAEDPQQNDQMVIKNLMVKTKELLARLQKLQTTDAAGQSFITMQALQEKKLPPYLQQFLYAVASAEGMARDTQASKAE